MARRRRPLVLEAARDLTSRGHSTAEVECEQDLPTRGMSECGDYLVERFELLFGIQAGSTSQMVSSSSTGPIGSHTAITSGVWCAMSDASPSFH